MMEDAGLGLAHSDEESDLIDMPDPLGGAGFGLPMLEKVLLAFIDAHDHPKGLHRRKRLNDAMQAVAGRKASPNALPRHARQNNRGVEEQEDAALLWMAQRYLAAPKPKPSDRSLAEAAADHFYRTANPSVRHARIEDLRKKFSGAYDRRKKDWKAELAPDVRHTFIYRASHDYVVESVEAQILRRIADELRRAGVPMSLPD